jgi:glycosyltransferase involved in cell wall biosynthesis
LLIPGLDRMGGAERQLLLLAEGLLLRDWRVSVITLSGDGGDAKWQLLEAGAGFLSLGMRKGLADPRGWIRLHNWLRSETPEIVHAHLAHAAWMARWSRLAAPTRVLVDTLHSSSTGTWGRRVGYQLSRWLPELTTAVSNAVAKTHLAAGMVGQPRLVLIPNGIDVEAFHPDEGARAAFRREMGWTDEFVWLAAGRLEAVKDYPTLLWAMTHLPKSARLLIAGSGPLETELRQLTETLGLQDRVQYLGFEAEIRRFMRAADGFVLSSRWEGLPMALLEAAACALPAVATDVAGTREALLQEQTGYLAAPGSALALHAAMLRLMQMPVESRKSMGALARLRVVNLYSLEAVLDRWESLYAELLDKTPSPRRWGRRA